MDAAVFEPVPLQSAIADGCTHVLVLCTRPAKVAGGASPLAKAAGKAVVRTIKRTLMNPPYMRDAWRRSEETNSSDEDDQALYGEKRGQTPRTLHKEEAPIFLPCFQNKLISPPLHMYRSVHRLPCRIPRPFGRARPALVPEHNGWHTSRLY